jgi:outer membrane protein assembly factor BamB
MENTDPDAQPSAASPVPDLPVAGVRWWPAAVIVLIAVLAIVAVHTAPGSLRAQVIIRILVVSGVAVVALAGWFWFFSRIPFNARWKTTAAILGCLALLAAAIRVEGLSGDLVPVLTFRWARRAGVAVPTKATSHAQPTAAAHLQPTPHDWPQFLGPDRNATLANRSLRSDWQAHPPREVWRIDIGAGWSSFAVVGDYVFTQEQRDQLEMVTCYTLANGEQVWAHSDEVRFSDFVAGDGPRATPTVHQGRVYAFGATGILNCLDASTGELVWSHDVVAELNGSVPTWGKSCSPLVDGPRVVVSAGGDEDRSLVAFDLQAGDVVWTAGTDRSSYSSPLRATLAGVPQIVIVGASHTTAHDPETGEVLWERPWHDSHPNVSQAVPIGADRLFLSAGYGHGCALFAIEHPTEGFTARELWNNLHMKTKFTNVVVRDSYIYGLDNGILACIDAEKGEQQWKRGRYGHGQIILAGTVILVQAESGSVHLIEANPDRHVELASLDALSSKTWNCPVLAGQHLILRNDREAVCYRLAD